MDVVVLIGGLLNIILVLVIGGFGFSNARKYRECKGSKPITTFRTPAIVLMLILNIVFNFYYTVYNVPAEGTMANALAMNLTDNMAMPVFFLITAAIHIFFGYSPSKNNLTKFSKFADDGYVVGMSALMLAPASVAVVTALGI